MAHGLLQPFDESQDLENIGNQYLKELESRSFFQDFNEEEGYGISYKFQMHDLAASLMKSECLILNSRGQRIPRTVQHLTFVDAEAFEIDFSSALPTSRVRTILSTVTKDETSQSFFVGSIIPRFKSLRLLDLDECDIEAFPEKSIGNLKHLRFLSLYLKIKKLPNSICKLHSLQTLVLGCLELEDLPRDIRYLINLRMLIFTARQRCLPKNGIGCLNSLRFLGIFGYENLEYLFEDMDGLKVLRTLAIIECPNLTSFTHDNIKYLSSLENLILDECGSLVLLNSSIESERENNHQDLMNSTGPPLRMLWLRRLTQLVELPQWLLQGTLQTLHIEDCCNLTARPESIQNLKSLQLLHIEDCPKLSSLPENMICFTALRELTIKGCDSLDERCKPEEGRDWPKIAHIPNIQLNGKIIKPNQAIN